MDALPVVSERESQTDSHPLLMEHVIGIPRDDVPSSSTPRRDNHDGMDQLPHDSESSSGTTAASNSPNAPLARRDDNRGPRRQSPLNSGFWISVELVVNLSQIIAAICVLSVSRNEHPHAPLFEWVIGYTIGCIATLPHLYWRYLHRNHLATVQESANQNYIPNNIPESNSFAEFSAPPVSEAGVVTGTNGVSRNNVVTVNPRAQAFADHFKMALDCFFAVWFVVGNVWVFGGRSSAHDAPNLYRLCIAFLTFSCIGYAMPFILCALICCCLPCIISVMGFREDLNQNRGASSDAINALGTYKFKLKKPRNGDGNEGGSGVLAAGTHKERVVSAEDAVCCICLARYVDNDELRLLPCGHFFHKDCVDKWLKINALCPLCKAELDVVSMTAPAMGFGRRHSDNRVGNDIESQQ
ncbi:E3 ubiquitin-protein ligase [Panicum miliaceum]|uniref:E3 ubiquitin-protein ligase n=1 Tax=Panicum miliaceum TaxID=4540 RepID=A0A3L6R490_PANMI|nr:E3 ubiquitin-protein ligase [Panicum miliaceum]